MSTQVLSHRGTAMLWVLHIATAGAAPSSAPEVGVDVYGNIDLKIVESDDDQVATTGLATLDVFFHGSIQDRVYALADVVFEEDDNAFFYAIDRYLVRVDLHPAFRVNAGQDHLPLVQWNRQVSHGRYLQTPIAAPLFLDREIEQGIWPTHFVGISVDGEVLDGRLGYLAAVSNGRGARFDQLQIRDDANHGKAMTASLHAIPWSSRTLALDAAVRTDRIPAAPDPIRELDLAASASLTTARVEVRAEVSQLRFSTIPDGSRHRVAGAYVLASYGVATRAGELRPYGMVAGMWPSDGFATIVYFADSDVTDTQYDVLSGLRWDPIPGFAVKAEVHLQLQDEELDHAVALQLAFGL